MSKKEELECSCTFEMYKKLQVLKKVDRLEFTRGTHTEINELSITATNMLEEMKNDGMMILIYAKNIIPSSDLGFKFPNGDEEKCFLFEFEEFSFFGMFENGLGKEPLIFDNVGIIFDVIPHE